MKTPDELFLPSLSIEGVRGIASLHASKLGRVNLFVGPNNAGKTSLLEALRLYASRGTPQAFRDILTGRGEVLLTNPQANLEDWGMMVQSVQAMFYGGLTGIDTRRLCIGPENDVARTLFVSLDWSKDQEKEEQHNRAFGMFSSVPTPAFIVEYAGDRSAEVLLTRLGMPVHPTIETQNYRASYVPPMGIGPDRLGTLWDRITLTEKESMVLDALRIIVPDLDGLSFIVESSRNLRTPVAKLRGLPGPVPLRNMGDGVNRVLSIALALVNAAGGFLLVDEFENGLYYGVQDEVWDVIFALSRRLGVQVFATTHSWDCIVGFQYAANRSEESGMLYRLERGAEGHIKAVAYTEGELEIAAEQRIEVR